MTEKPFPMISGRGSECAPRYTSTAPPDAPKSAPFTWDYLVKERIDQENAKAGKKSVVQEFDYGTLFAS